MNFLHDIPAGDPKKLLNAIIEIPAGAKIKYEYDNKLQVIKADRFLYTAFAYPFNYGFIPGTWSEDEDPLDVVVVASEKIEPYMLVEVRVIGMLETEDEEGKDAKLITVPKSKIDPVYANVESVEDLGDALKNKIKHFYETYKSIEPGKWVKVTGWLDKAAAINTVESAIERYNAHVKTS